MSLALEYFTTQGSSYRQSAVLQKVTGMTTDLYAEKYLYKPMGITECRRGIGPAAIIVEK